MWHTVHTVTGRAAVSLWLLSMCMCVCVCEHVWHEKELTLSFMTVSIMFELNGSLLPMRHLCKQLWVNPLPGKEIAQYCFNSTVNCHCTLPIFRGREADLLCFLTVPIVCRNVAECPWNGCNTNNAQTHPHFSAEDLVYGSKSLKAGISYYQ